MRRTAVLVLIAGLLLFLVPLNAAAQEESPENAENEITLQEAVDRALELSEMVKMAELRKEIAWEQRSDAQDAVSYTPTGMVNPQIETAYAQLLQAELGYQISSKSYDALRGDIKATVVEKYCAVQSAKESVESAEAALRAQEWQQRASQLKLQVGMLAPVKMTELKASTEEKRSSLTAAKENLETAYVKFNSAAGIPTRERPELVTQVEYSPLEINGFQAEVSRAIGENANKSSMNIDVWSKLQEVIVERQDLRMALKPYDIEKLEVEIAELDAAQARENLETQLQTMHSNIVRLRSRIDSLEQGLKAAEQGVKTSQVMYDVGMSTREDQLNSGANLASVRSRLSDLKSQYNAAAASYRNLTGRDVLPENYQENENGSGEEGS